MFFSPLKFLVLPFVLPFAIPLALCAGVTTVLAFLVLFFQLFFVYLDVGWESLRYAFVGRVARSRYATSRNMLVPTAEPSTTSTLRISPSTTSFGRRRRPKPQGGDGISVVAPSIGLERDFEGVGGWRIGGGDADTDTIEDQQWYTLNSRLENPYRPHHFRSQSGSAIMSGPAAAGLIKSDLAVESRSAESKG